MTSRLPRVVYDSDSDVLYVSSRPGKCGIARESMPGVLWRYEPGTEEIVGVTVIDFMGYWRARLNDPERDLAKRLQIGPGEMKSLLSLPGG